MRHTKFFSSSSMQGFTYFGVLFGVAILGMGLVRAAEVVSVADQRMNERALLAIGNEFREALRRYYEVKQLDGSHKYPSSLDHLLSDSRDGIIRRHLRKIYVDPMTGKAEWGIVRFDGRIVGIHSLSTKRTIKRLNFSELDSDFVGKVTVDQWVFAYYSR